MKKFTKLIEMTVRHPEKINNPIHPIKKKPKWIRSKILDTQNYFKTKEIINKKKLHTVCQEASCPNISECWSKKQLIEEKKELSIKLALVEKKNMLLTDKIDLDYLEILLRKKFMLGKSNEKIFKIY